MTSVLAIYYNDVFATTRKADRLPKFMPPIYFAKQNNHLCENLKRRWAAADEIEIYAVFFFMHAKLYTVHGRSKQLLK